MKPRKYPRRDTKITFGSLIVYETETPSRPETPAFTLLPCNREIQECIATIVKKTLDFIVMDLWTCIGVLYVAIRIQAKLIRIQAN